VDARSTHVAASPAKVFVALEHIGGEKGWHYANWLWTLRGWLDLLIGGVGMRRGRRDPERLQVGDTLDCWRVELIQPGQRLRLAAEMKLPGRPGWNSKCNRMETGRCCARWRRSIRSDCGGWRIGMACGRCTKSCSRGCCAAFRVRPAKMDEYSS
jgi:hypothetical protein